MEKAKVFNKKVHMCRKEKYMESYLQYGEEKIFEAGTVIYKAGDPNENKPIFFITAGLIKIEITLAGGAKFPLYLQPDSIFGLVEPLVECNRLTSAFAMEPSILYSWDLENFELASGVSWELALTSITGLTRLLRILNAEFGEKIGLIKR